MVWGRVLRKTSRGLTLPWRVFLLRKRASRSHFVLVIVALVVEERMQKAIWERWSFIISSLDFAPKAISTLNCCLCSVFRPTFIFKKSSHFHKDVFSHYLDDICVWQSLALAAHCEERQEVAETRWLGFTTSNLKIVKVLSLKSQKSFLFRDGGGMEIFTLWPAPCPGGTPWTRSLWGKGGGSKGLQLQFPRPSPEDENYHIFHFVVGEF